MKQTKSIFEHLRVLEFSHGECRQGYHQEKVFGDGGESVEIYTAEIEPGRWAWGYNVYFSNERNAHRFPNLEYGYCRSERDAKLFILGVLLVNGRMFTQTAREAIGNAITELQQLKLF